MQCCYCHSHWTFVFPFLVPPALLYEYAVPLYLASHDKPFPIPWSMQNAAHTVATYHQTWMWHSVVWPTTWLHTTFSTAMRSGWYGGKRRIVSSWAFNRSSRTYLSCLSLRSFIKAQSFNCNKSPQHGFFSAATKFSSFLDEDLGSYN